MELWLSIALGIFVGIIFIIVFLAILSYLGWTFMQSTIN